MPLPMMVPTTMAVAWETPSTRGRSPGCTGAAVWAESAVVMGGARVPCRFALALDFDRPGGYSWGDNSSGSPTTAILPLAS